MNTHSIIASDKKTDSSITSNSENEKIEVGLSACLAGQNVRYNGGHSQSDLCLKKLDKYFDYKTFCPEVAAGFSIPRQTMRLVGDPNDPKVQYTKDKSDVPEDLTKQLRQGFEPVMDSFSHLHGYILMKNSPSCGLERIKVYQSNGYTHKEKVSGLFAQALQKNFPFLPIEEEGRLNDSKLRENFILRVYAHHNFHKEVINLDHPKLKDLLKFHASYKYVLMAYHLSSYKKLGQLLANAKATPIDQVINEYFQRFMHALAKPAHSKHHTNTMLHILGYLNKSINSTARQQIADVIFQYRDGEVPLITPLTLLNHYLVQYGNEYIRAQRYLNPYPSALGLASHV